MVRKRAHFEELAGFVCALCYAKEDVLRKALDQQGIYGKIELTAHHLLLFCPGWRRRE